VFGGEFRVRIAHRFARSPPPRRDVNALSALFLTVVCIFRQPYLFLRVRVRQWGRLPFRRGPTVLLANHQHEDESEIIMERAFIGGPWAAPLFTASTRRMFEPGFFATRMRWLGFMRHVNAGPLFRSLGMLPLENQLASRPLASLAREMRARHGDLAIEEVIAPPGIARLPNVPPRLGALDDAAYSASATTMIKLAHVREPYRDEALTTMRAGIEKDLARIVGIVQRGATFFVTAEGNYSIDGRMRPLKGVLDRLTPIADVWLAAIAYDPFRGERLSLLYRILTPADPRDLATSLAAARPVTTSAVLATFLAATPRFRPDEALVAVRAQLAALPANVFVDPELVRDPARTTGEALAALERRAIVRRDGDTYVLADERRDRHFPLVVDIVSYQRNFHEETLAAARRLERGP
jgi:hypothetical protein